MIFRFHSRKNSLGADSILNLYLYILSSVILKAYKCCLRGNVVQGGSVLISSWLCKSRFIRPHTSSNTCQCAFRKRQFEWGVSCHSHSQTRLTSLRSSNGSPKQRCEWGWREVFTAAATAGRTRAAPLVCTSCWKYRKCTVPVSSSALMIQVPCTSHSFSYSYRFSYKTSRS